jgi:hypothetical protein
MPGSLSLRALALGTLLCFAWPALAQDEEREPSTGYGAIIDNIDLLVDNYAKFLGRKYDLTEEQDEYTKFLLRERAYEFLDKHEEDLRGLVDHLFDVRTGGDMTPEELSEWGRQAGPLYEEAKRLIIVGNEDWREILTPDQQSIHDEDLELMRQSFETTEEQLGRIVSGEMTVDEFRSPQRGRRSPRSQARRPTPPRELDAPPPPEEPQIVKDDPPAKPLGKSASTPRRREPAAGPTSPSAKPGGDRAVRPPSTTKSPRVKRPPSRADRSKPGTSPRDAKRGAAGGRKATQPESAWEKYVREFIAKYQLNNEQTQKANAVLEDCQAQAERYTIGRKTRLEQLDQQIAEQRKSKDKDKSKRLAELNKQRGKLTEPLDRIFEQQLQPRLERLPTRAQRRAAETAASKKPTEKKVKASRGKATKKTPGGKDD